MKSKLKISIITALIITFLFIVVSTTTVVVHFFSGNISSKLPKETGAKCSIKEEKYKNRSVFVIDSNNKNEKNQKVIFFLHGGSYMAELSSSHWDFLTHFSQDTGACIVAPDYPLAPQYNYRDVFEMVFPLYEEITKKVDAKNIIIMGDSAGGGMSLALAEKIIQENKASKGNNNNSSNNIENTSENSKNKKIVNPSKVILISPWLDVTMSNPEIAEFESKDKMLNKELLRLAGISYAGSEENTKNYLISPIYGELEGLENVTIYTGTYDILNPDAHKLVKLAKEKRSKHKT